MIDLTTKTDAQIDNLIRNHEEKDARDRPLYPALLEERAKRAQARSSLSFEKSLDLLRRAAMERRCVSYGDLAEASDVPWSEARHKMNGAHGHLDLLLDICHANGLPLLTQEGWDFAPERTKILMLTHNAIAAKQGYPNIARIFEHKEAFAKKEDPAIAFLADSVEPICAAYSSGNFGEMFRLMGNAPTLKESADKAQWRADMDELIRLRHSGTVGDVIDLLKETRRPRLNDRVARRDDEVENSGPEPTEGETKSITRHRELRAVSYAELIAVTEFINGFTPFATQHSVKGAQFENVLVILSGGWNHYNWPRLLEQMATGKIAAKERAGHLRARNLLYVALSRPKKRLAVLATQALSQDALNAAGNLFGIDNVLSLAAE